MSDECIFCRIARGEIPAAVVYEDDAVLAFDDLSPQAPVHTLVIPKRHFADFGDGIDAETLGALFSALPEIARRKGVADTGYRVIVNNGPDANQTVKHLHVHLMGGRSMAHGMVVFADE
ncbi:MAG: histidine triad nucleotide-binding protein [Actinobacteria bacterium]|nr:MAG: histidine triad nucleotide-binding protein [Actinomycetota bacterium]